VRRSPVPTLRRVPLPSNEDVGRLERNVDDGERAHDLAFVTRDRRQFSLSASQSAPLNGGTKYDDDGRTTTNDEQWMLDDGPMMHDDGRRRTMGP
jgi:hypothetical protein